MISLGYFMFLLLLELYFKLYEKLKHLCSNLNGNPIVSQLYSSPLFRIPNHVVSHQLPTL